MKPYQIVLAVVIVLIALVFADCRKRDSESTSPSPVTSIQGDITFSDARNKSITLRHSAIKIVSLLPSITEYLFELDRGHLLIGRSDWCRYPAEALEVEVVGGLDKAVDERLVALKPDAVLVSKMMRDEQVQHLESLGLTVIVFDHQNWDTVLRDLEMLGKILGAEGDIKTLTSWLERKRQSVQDELESLENSTPVSAAVLYSLKPLYTAGAGTFVDELITLCGGSNVASDLSSPWPTLSMEGLLQKQPDVLLVSTEAAPVGELPDNIQALATDPVWSQLAAIQNNRVYILDGDTLAVPGPRQVVALAQIAAALHPELFEAPEQLQHVNLLPASLVP